jgi:hypothetical protein
MFSPSPHLHLIDTVSNPNGIARTPHFEASR